MLQSLHKTSTGLFAKILLFLLVASLGLWGIGDIFSSGSSGSALVNVGEGKVTAIDFQREYAKEQANFRRMLGDSYSNELLQSLNIPNQVVQRLIQRKLIQEETRTAGLDVPLSHVKKLLKQNPSFQGEDGRFDALLFKNLLAENRMTEDTYVDLVREDTASRVMMEAIFTEMATPTTTVNLIYKHKYEKRMADLLVLPKTLIQNIPTPSDEDLQSFYESNAEHYTAPELRTFTALTLKFDDYSKAIQIPDDELLIAYQDRIDQYHKPETRELEQLIFTNKETADKALASLKDGSTMQIAKGKFDAMNEEITLGSLTAQSVLPEAEQAIFEAKEGTFTTPVESNFGWHIFYVKKITPARTQPLAEVKDDLLAVVRNERAEEEIYELSNRLQDDIAAGLDIKEVAKNASLKTTTFGPVQMSGNGPDGTNVALPEGFESMLPAAFEIQEGKTGNVQELPNGSYFAVHVDHVMPERVKTLEEVRAKAIEDWKRNERMGQLQQLAEGVASQLKTESIDEVARKTGAKLLKGQELTRTSAKLSGDYTAPPALISDVFEGEVGDATSAHQMREGGFVIAKISAIESADANAESANNKKRELARELANEYQEEMFMRYLAYLSKKHGVSEVNQALLDAILAN